MSIVAIEPWLDFGASPVTDLAFLESDVKEIALLPSAWKLAADLLTQLRREQFVSLYLLWAVMHVERGSLEPAYQPQSFTFPTCASLTCWKVSRTIASLRAFRTRS